MEFSLPHRINGEKELKIYENFLIDDRASTNSSSHKRVPPHTQQRSSLPANPDRCKTVVENPTTFVPDPLANAVFFQGYLKNHIGKLVKVESFLGDCLDNRAGILMSVGVDHIVLKLQRSCCSMMIQTASIKYITIIHDNDMSKMHF